MNFKSIVLSTLLLGIAPFYSFCQSLTDSLVYYYPMNGNANDASGNNNHLTVNGAALTTDRFGKANSAYNFTGNAGLSTTFDMTGFTAMTISAWVKTNYTAEQATVIWMEGTTVLYANRFSSGKFFAAFDGTSANNSSSQETNSTITNNQWTLVTAVNDGTKAYLYINGNLENTYSETLLNKQGNMVIGLQNNSLWGWRGSIDDVRVYNRVLTENEINTIYNHNPASVSENGIRSAAYINMYPNPANTKLNVNFSKTGKYILSIADVTGKICQTEVINSTNNNSEIINLATLSKGMYIVTINGSDFFHSQKLIIQ